MAENINEIREEINLHDVLKIIIKRKNVIIALTCFAVLTALIVSSLSPKIYRGDAFLRIPQFETPSSNITAKEIVDLIGKIDSYKKQQLLPKTHASIVAVKINALKESRDKLEVVFEATDISVMAESLSEIRTYINNIAMIKTNIREEQDKISKRVAELASVIEASSMLLNIYSRLLQTGKLMPVGFNPVELNKRISDIKLEKQVAEQYLLRLQDGVDIARKLDVNTYPIKPKMLFTTAIAGIISLFVGILVAFLLEYMQKMPFR